MYLIESKRDGKWIKDPGLAMALQEHVKDNLFLDDDILFPYIMDPAVQIGKFQNAYEEVNQLYMEDHDIQLIRRESGGGAIYLDDRNMSFCYLFNSDNNIYGNYEKLYQPIIEALGQLGVTDLKQKGRNDLTIAGKKVSGAAMTIYSGRIYAGYSLLLDPNYEAMLHVLNPNQKKIQSHGIQSVRSRVGSIRPYLKLEYRDMTVWDFTDYIICQLLGITSIDKAKRYTLTADDWAKIDALTAKKYHNWDWNYGHFRTFTNQITERFAGGTVTIGMEAEYAKIKHIQITGDFFGVRQITDIEHALIGVRLRRDDILQALEPFDLNQYIGKLTKQTLAQYLLGIPATNATIS